jgi:hypothetical protein
VIGVSDRLQVKVVLKLDRSLKNIFINPQLLRSPSNLRANILEAIFFQKHYVNEDAQKFREHQVQLMISELARVAKPSMWDVEATMLAVKVRQATASVNTHCCARNSLVSVGRGQRGDIERLVLNSIGVCDSRELEGSIVDAAHQGHRKVRDLQETWPFSELGLL